MPKNTSVLALRSHPIPLVRIGLIGLGQRGLATLRRYAYIEGAEIQVLANLTEAPMLEAQKCLRESGRPAARTFVGEEAWREVCKDENLDLIYICTDWASHTPIALEAMSCGKHVAVEVPAATSVEECWALVRMAEATQRHCFMTENCCYDWFALGCLGLRDAGYFGTITHCEGAYLHDWRALFSTLDTEGARAWYRDSCRHGGNPYPTHGIGPIAQLLGLHRQDRLSHLVSMTGKADGEESLLGHANTTLLTTERGVTILLQFDGTTPRPYSRIQGVSGTKGFVQKYPLIQASDAAGERTPEDAETWVRKHMKGHAADLWREGEARGVDNPMNYAMDARLIHCLREGLPLDIDVYDAAEWSCLAELSRLSAQQGGAIVKVPNFLSDTIEG